LHGLRFYPKVYRGYTNFEAIRMLDFFIKYKLTFFRIASFCTLGLIVYNGFTTGFGGFMGYQFMLTLILPLFVAIGLYFFDRASHFLIVIFFFEKVKKQSSIIIGVSLVQIFISILIYLYLKLYCQWEI